MSGIFKHLSSPRFLRKRIISWISNHQISYNEIDEKYRSMFDHMIQKQTNHLLNEMKNSKDLENKIIGCSAIILTGLCYKIEKNYLDIGLSFLEKIGLERDI